MKRHLSIVLYVWLICSAAYAQILSPIVNFGKPRSVASGNSLIFTAASSQYLSATGKTNINQQKFTFSSWFKSSSATNQAFFYFGDGTVNNEVFAALTSGIILLVGNTSGGTVLDLQTSATFDDGNWHSLVISVDTTQATNSNRAIIYVDGTAATLGSATYPTQNTNLSNNFADTYDVGQNASNYYFNGKLAQVYYIDGQRLTPSSFITGTPGVPKTYSGTYTGHFDFFLPFSNGTSTTTLGADSSGESNNWTLNAMTTANQSTDYP